MSMKILNKLNRKIFYYKKLYAQYSDPDSVFIYQMGKVGSTTLENALPKAVHVHAFYEKNHPCPVRQQGLARFGLANICYRLEQYVLAMFLRAVFRRRKKTKIVTLVREPKARNLSMFFHDLDAYLFEAHTNCLGRQQRAIPTRMQSKRLIEDAYLNCFNHQYPLDWYDKEFLPMTGIDVYSQPFDSKQGMMTIYTSHVDVILLKAEQLNDNIDNIAKFLGRDIVLQDKNQAKSKWYADLYQSFKTEFSMPNELQEKIEKSKLFNKFYSS